MADPLSLALVAIGASLLGSDRVRKILSNIFSNPKSRSVVLEVDGETIVLDNIDADEQKRLIEKFLKEHSQTEPTSASEEADAGKPAPNTAKGESGE
jgi:hypothetical protein